MRAAVLREPGDVRVEAVELDSPRAGEVLVRVAAAGVCHSDVTFADGGLGSGHWPAVLGHEGAGIVESIGEGVTRVRPGDSVAFCFVPACRRCRFCAAGRPNLCEVVATNGARGTLMDGTSRLALPDGTALQHAMRTACFAEYAVIAAGGAVAIPPKLPPLAGRTARLRRRHRHRGGAQRRPRGDGRVGGGDRLRRCRPTGDRRRPVGGRRPRSSPSIASARSWRSPERKVRHTS